MLIGLLVVPIVVRLRPLGRAARACWRARPIHRSWRRSLVAAALVLVGAGPLASAFVPFYGWDALTYHLAVPERYLFHGGIWMTPFSIFSACPHTVEMLYALALGIGGPPLAKLINLQYAVLLMVTAYRLAARRSLRAGLIALALLIGEPLLQWEVTLTYNDLALAFHALVAVAALADWRVHHEPGLL